ncbi:MAG TPA: hypothetical protein PK156_00260 [Polyangium sp.]|nr:hypothetical protein [Polyangium sp.]
MHRSLHRLEQGGLPLVVAFLISSSASAADPPATLPSSPKNQIEVHASLADGLGLRREDKLFSVDLGILTQMRYTMTLHETKVTDDGFNVLMVRPVLRVKALNDTVRLFVQPELGTPTPKLLDFELTWQPIPQMGLRVGQFLTPFTRAFLTPVPLLQFTDFNRVNAKFRADRDTGAMLFGATKNGKLDYWLGAFNGNGIDKGGNDDTTMMGITRVAVNPVRAMPYDETPSLKGAVPFGIAIALDGIADRAHPTKMVTDPATGTQTTVNLTPETRLTGGADISIAYKSFTFLTEGFMKVIEPDGGARTTSIGAYAQAGIFAIPKRLEFAVRGGYMDPNRSKDKDTESNFEGLITGYFVGNHLKLGGRYTMIRNEAKTADGLAPGVNHRFIIQTQLWL